MSCLSEVLCQLSRFLKPVMDRAVEEPLYRMHHGRYTFTLEVNWSYAKESSKNLEKISTPVTEKQDGYRLSRRNLERNRHRRERRKEARAQRLKTATPAKSPIVIFPAKSTTPPRSPMDTLPHGEGEPPPPPDELKEVKWHPGVKETHNIASYGFLDEDAFMYRSIKKDTHYLVIVALPMFTTDPDNKHRRAYALTSYVNHRHMRDLEFRASAKKVDLLTTLCKVTTAVEVGSATTLKMVDATNARPYVRASDGKEHTLKEISATSKSFFLPDPDDTPPYVIAR